MKCKNCVNLKDEWCGKVIDSPHPDIERDCHHFVCKTNADHIRSMTDEELANLLTHYSNNGGWVTEMGRTICYERIADWLKLPYKEKV